MNILRLPFKYLMAKPLSTVLNVLLFAFGIGIINLLIIANKQVSNNLVNNAKGIDMVVGAKGSPLQIILCSIFHIDFPTGNIQLYEAEQLARKRLVKNVIPLALGDSYQGSRIVGTTAAYVAHYNGVLDKGDLFHNDLEVVLGSNTAEKLGLTVGSTFTGQHGMSEGAYDHEGHAYQVVGVLKLSGTVLDDLILCSVPSVWEMHAEEEVHDPHEAHEAHEGHETHAQEEKRLKVVSDLHRSDLDSSMQITSMLVQFRSPMGAVQLPRMINEKTNMQAAIPAFEITRLISIMGNAISVMNALGIVLVAVALLSVFISLFNALKERKYDLAILRTMGGTPIFLLSLIVVEGMLLMFFGCSLGILLVHGGLELALNSLDTLQKSGIDGTIFYREELYIVLMALLAGVVVAIIPAVAAYKTDISKILGDK